MTSWLIAIRSLVYYLRSNLAVAAGVAAATAVLTGALVVGDSMRTSLRDLSLDRLGKIDELIVSDGFFRAELAEELAQTRVFEGNYLAAVPVIMFPNGTVEGRRSIDGKPDRSIGGNKDTVRASNVGVLGVTPKFWSLGSGAMTGHEDELESAKRGVIINQALSEQLWPEDAVGREISLRIPKPVALPSDSALGKTDDLIESLVRLKVVAVIPDEGLGRFSLTPSQTNAPNIFVPIALLQDSLSRSSLAHKTDSKQANAILLAGKPGSPEETPNENTSVSLMNTLRPSLADCGLNLKRVTQKFDPQREPDDNVPAAEPELADSELTEPELELVYDYWSLSSERLVISDSISDNVSTAFPESLPVFTYLSNDIRIEGESSGVPFSMIASVEFGPRFALQSSGDQTIDSINDNEIVLNSWTAEDLGAEPGDRVVVTFFEPETTHGNQSASQATFVVSAVAALTEPGEPFRVRRGDVVKATFLDRPTRANDPDLTPVVPGVTDADSIESWDLPFETASVIRPQDDSYWNDYRTTPKAFVSLAAGRAIWSSRFGNTTSFRISANAGSRDYLETKLLDQFANSDSGGPPGFHLVPVKRQAIAASSGSTPFDVLFLALSMFVIGSALALVSLLFRLSLQSRAAEIGVMKAAGLDQKKVLSIWLREMLVVCALGAIAGVLLGIGYAALMIHGLRTWWVGAISQPFVELHAGPLSLIAGLVSGLLVCLLTIWWSLRSFRKVPVRSLLSGQLEEEKNSASLDAVGVLVSKMKRGKGMKSVLRVWIIPVLVASAIGLSVMAAGLSGDAQAGAFMGSGFLILSALLIWNYRWLRGDSGTEEGQGGAAISAGLGRLAFYNTRRNPLRSTLTISLVAVAGFLIVAVSSFRLAPTEAGTAGFDFIADSSQAVFENLNTVEGQTKLLGTNHLLAESTRVYSLRLKPGQDASCNNLYQSTQPRVLGVSREFVERFDSPDATAFAWGATMAATDKEKANPWRLLEQTQDDDAIPVMIDKNTANYSLKIFAVGGIYKVAYDSGETIRFRVVGFLSNTILQGSLIVSEENFTRAFPNIGGYRFFLIDLKKETRRVSKGVVEKETRRVSKGVVEKETRRVSKGVVEKETRIVSKGVVEKETRRVSKGVVEKETRIVSKGVAGDHETTAANTAIATLESRLGDEGFDARDANKTLAGFMSVQNTYLDTFQSLGLLGLLLGTFGLAAVQMRSVLERRKEFGLMRAVGFARSRLSRMILLENAWLLLIGLVTGIVSAVFATLPHYFVGTASVPWVPLAGMFALVVVVGLFAGLLASRLIGRIPLMDSLR